MIRLKTYIRVNDGILKCPSCKVDLYRFIPPLDVMDESKRTIRASDFEPIGGNPAPIYGQPIKCPWCGWQIGVGNAPVWVND